MSQLFSNTIEALNSGYSQSGASLTRENLKGFTAVSSSAHEDIEYNNPILRQRARALYMASPIAASAIKTNRTNIIGRGLRLQSSIDKEVLGLTTEQAEAWQKKTEKEFALWASSKSCDALGLCNFNELQQLALQSWLLSGDAFALLERHKPSKMEPYSLRIHLIEADRVSTPMSLTKYLAYNRTTGFNEVTGRWIYDGIEVDAKGRPVAYHICSHYPGESKPECPEIKWQAIQARQKRTGLPNILHLMDAERPEQYRGVPYLAQVIEPLLQLRRYTDAELTAAVIESFFTVFVTTEEHQDDPFEEPKKTSDVVPSSAKEYNLGAGTVHVMKPNQSITSADPKRPSNGFEGFVKAITRQIGAALEIPADLLLKEFNASYSASRAALLEAWKTFRMRREWLAEDFCKPVYETWLSEAVALGRIDAPGFFNDPLIHSAWLGSSWLGPSQGQLDPVKEITAEILACSEGFSTHEQSTTKLNGGKWDSNIERLRIENEKLQGQAPDAHQEKTSQQEEEKQEKVKHLAAILTALEGKSS